MSIDDYKFELQAKKAELASLMLLLSKGKQIMLELASAADGCALGGEPFPEELNERVSNWCRANWTLPLAEALPENKRYVEGQLMTWAGLPVFVDGIATTSPENWPLIDANDTTPKPPGESPAAP